MCVSWWCACRDGRLASLRHPDRLNPVLRGQQLQAGSWAHPFFVLLKWVLLSGFCGEALLGCKSSSCCSESCRLPWGQGNLFAESVPHAAEPEWTWWESLLCLLQQGVRFFTGPRAGSKRVGDVKNRGKWDFTYGSFNRSWTQGSLWVPSNIL